MTPDELRKEANAAEFLARVVSYARDKEWLLAKAADLREQAERLEATAETAPDGRGEEGRGPEGQAEESRRA